MQEIDFIQQALSDSNRSDVRNPYFCDMIFYKIGNINKNYAHLQ
jgi:hypothetical protein